MKFALAFFGVAVICGLTEGQIEVTADPLVCSPEETAKALQTVPHRMRVFYKPLLNVDINELRRDLDDGETVRFHVECILRNKACTSLGKAMQYFMTSQSAGQQCTSCQTPCLLRRLKVILHEIYCKFPLIADDIRQHVFSRNNLDVISYFLGENPRC